MQALLFKGKVVLKKYPGKGGWTYASLPGVKRDKHSNFGWIQVTGRIDDYQLSNYKVTFTSNGEVFLPVKAEVRKIIQKGEGDSIEVELFRQQSSLNVQESFMECLGDEPDAELFFRSLEKTLQQQWIDWVSEPIAEEVQVERMAAAVSKLANRISRI